MLCSIWMIFISISSAEVRWLVLTGSFSNHPFTKIPPRTTTSIWIQYYLKNLQGLYSGSLKEINTQSWGRGFFNSLLCLVLFFWNNLGVSMAYQIGENFKILNFPFGYKKLCILISTFLFSWKRTLFSIFLNQSPFFLFQRDLFYQVACRRAVLTT